MPMPLPQEDPDAYLVRVLEDAYLTEALKDPAFAKRWRWVNLTKCQQARELRAGRIRRRLARRTAKNA